MDSCQTLTNRIGCCYPQKRLPLLIRPDGSDGVYQPDGVVYLSSSERRKTDNLLEMTHKYPSWLSSGVSDDLTSIDMIR